LLHFSIEKFCFTNWCWTRRTSWRQAGRRKKLMTVDCLADMCMLSTFLTVNSWCKHKNGYVYQEICEKPQLFNEDDFYLDVQQGHLGDSWLLPAVGAFLPGQSLHENYSGIFHFCLFVDGKCVIFMWVLIMLSYYSRYKHGEVGFCLHYISGKDNK